MTSWQLSLALTVALATNSAAAQEVPAIETPEVIALDQNERAPFAGMLVVDSDLIEWRMTIERLRFQLESERTFASGVLSASVAREQVATHAAEDRLTLHEALWRTEAERLARELAAAQTRSDEWWRSPVLWFSVGMLVAIAAVVAVDVAR